MTSRPLVLLVAVGFEAYRGYLLRMVAESKDVWLLTDDEPGWETEYVVGSTVVDTHDTQALLAAAKQVAAERRIDGVLCWDELKMRSTAEIAVTLGLPGVHPDVVERCRDKHLTRCALAAAGTPQPRSEVVCSADEAADAARSLGYPVVLKPRALGASMGVTLVTRPGELVAAYAHTSTTGVPEVPRYTRGVLVEQYVDGPEISVDCAVFGGRVTPMFVARKTSGFPPYFEELGHLVNGADPLTDDPGLRQLLADAHQALGFDSGVTHVELRLAPDGWRVIEVNCRLGGDMIPYLGGLALGVDAGRVASDIACGLAPRIERTRSAVAGVRFLYPDEPTTVESVVIDRERLPQSVVLARATAGRADILEPPPRGHVWSRYAMVIVATDTAEACRADLARATDAIRLTGVRRPPSV